MFKYIQETQVTQNNIMSCILILASVCVLYKFYVHNKIEVVCMVVLVVGSESSQNWVRVVSGLGPIRLGSEKYQGSELSWVRVVRLPLAKQEQPEDQWSCKRSPEICCIYQ